MSNGVHLARLVLDPRPKQVRDHLTKPHEMHRTLMKCFPQHSGPNARSKFGVLWRTEPDARDPVILMQSHIRPELTNLPGELIRDSAVKDMALDSLRAGLVVHYRVMLNPIRKNRAGGNTQSVVPSAARAEWASAKLSKAGLVLIDDVIVTGMPASKIHRQGRSFRHYSVRVDGIAKVNDIDDLSLAIRQGLGSAKAWGCGLLTIRPASRAH